MMFEVILFNEQVRAKVREGEHHRTFTDDWADTHYIEMKASDEAGAMRKARQKYPAEDGFIIEGISEA